MRERREERTESEKREDGETERVGYQTLLIAIFIYSNLTAVAAMYKQMGKTIKQNSVIPAVSTSSTSGNFAC